MIRHVVLLKPAADATAGAVAAALAGVVALKGVIPGVLAVRTGPNVSPEGLGRGYTQGFVVDFADAAARDAYLPHPAHQTAGAALVAVAEGGIEGILVFDLEMG
ncbi:MAG: Dabb family protein [Alsobacter sp.]